MVRKKYLCVIMYLFGIMMLMRLVLQSSNHREYGLSNGFDKKTRHPTLEEEFLSNLTYENQKLERSTFSKLSTSLASFDANWPCMWGEEVTGYSRTWSEHWDKFKDGWKFTCGVRLITPPCIVYSLGSAGNMAFERGVLDRNPACQIYIYDKEFFDAAEWFTKEQLSKVHFKQYFISNEDDDTATPPRRTLSSLMQAVKHNHIDVLKMDIEGGEWQIIANASTPLPSIGQFLAEVHEDSKSTVEARVQRLHSFFNMLEASGLRLFHREVNARYDVHCIEYAFIQARWRPDCKKYA